VTKASEGTLKLLVIDEETEFVAAQPDAGSYQEEGLGTWLRRAFVKEKTVDLAKVQQDLDKVQAQVDGLLATVDTTDRSGFALSAVQVSLGMSAEGSIGVVTAGVEVTIALTYERRR